MSLDKKSFTFNHEGSDINIEVVSLTVDGILWLLANPFAKVLGYSNKPNAISNHVNQKNQVEYEEIKPRNENDSTTICIQPRSKFINEAGLDELITNSTMPRAKLFQSWICNDVLPSLDRPLDKFKIWWNENIDKNFLNSVDDVTKNGSIYVCTTTEWQQRNIYKIGMTHNLEGKLEQLNTAHFNNFFYIYTYNCKSYKNLETYLHSYFKNNLLKREFFKLMEDDLIELISICENFDN